MTARERKPRGEGLRLETLLIASISSLVAALIVSRLWVAGTPIAAALMPVLVALVGEGLRKPMRSERVRRAASVTAAPIRRYRTGEVPAARGPEEPTTPLPPEPDETPRGEPEPDGEARAEPRTGAREPGADGGEPRPYRVYPAGRDGRDGTTWRDRLTPRRVRIALVTGLLAFLLAAAALTLPELLFEGSVSGGGRNTTLFGGGGDDADNGRGGEDEPDGGRDQLEEPVPADPSEQPEGDEPEPDQPSEEPPPEETTPAPTEPLPEPPPETAP